VAYKDPVERRIEIRGVGELRTTSTGNSYLECVTDLGVVAFWGELGAMTNINKIASADVPFTATCGCIDANWEQHALWVPQAAKVEILAK
jgi:hypothetical protein